MYKRQGYGGPFPPPPRLYSDTPHSNAQVQVHQTNSRAVSLKIMLASIAYHRLWDSWLRRKVFPVLTTLKELTGHCSEDTKGGSDATWTIPRKRSENTKKMVLSKVMLYKGIEPGRGLGFYNALTLGWTQQTRPGRWTGLSWSELDWTVLSHPRGYWWTVVRSCRLGNMYCNCSTFNQKHFKHIIFRAFQLLFKSQTCWRYTFFYRQLHFSSQPGVSNGFWENEAENCLVVA